MESPGPSFAGWRVRERVPLAPSELTWSGCRKRPTGRPTGARAKAPSPAEAASADTVEASAGTRDGEGEGEGSFRRSSWTVSLVTFGRELLPLSAWLAGGWWGGALDAEATGGSFVGEDGVAVVSCCCMLETSAAADLLGGKLSVGAGRGLKFPPTSPTLASGENDHILKMF